jgi:hypothetical protein
MSIWEHSGKLSDDKRSNDNREEDEPVTKPLRWPNDCMDARDRAAEAAISGIRILEPVLGDLPLSDVEQTRRAALALAKFHEIARLLESVGAPTRP